MLHATMLIFADAYILSLAGLPVMSLVKIHPQRTWCNNIPQIKLKWPPHYYHPKSFKKLVLIGVRAGGARGAAAPPNFGQLKFFGQREKIWAKPVLKDVPMFI